MRHNHTVLVKEAYLSLSVFAGIYIPSCDEDGYYRKVQCDQSRGECWCVDQHGGEIMGSRIHGNPDCGKKMALRRSKWLASKSWAAKKKKMQDAAPFSSQTV